MQDRQLSTENIDQAQSASPHGCLMGFLWVGTITEDLFGTGRVNNVYDAFEAVKEAIGE